MASASRCSITAWLRIGPVGSWIWQRNTQSYSSSLNGLGHVSFTGLLGGFVDYWAVPWLRTRAEVMQSFGGGIWGYGELSSWTP